MSSDLTLCVIYALTHMTMGYCVRLCLPEGQQTYEQGILGNEASVQVSCKALCTEGVLLFFLQPLEKAV